MTPETKAEILLVEDDVELSAITAKQLERYGYQVACASTGHAALAALDRMQIDLLLLDVMLPDCDGHELCEQLRSEEIGYQGAIIFMSCLGDSSNIVSAFRRGGNDFLVKPVKIDTLVERIEANLVNCQPKRNEETRKWFRQFMIDTRRKAVYRVENNVTGQEISVSPIEYSILVTLTEHPNEVILYNQLYKSVWNQEDLGDVRTLMVHVSNLRKKLDLDHTDIFRAIRGAGYMFQDC